MGASEIPHMTYQQYRTARKLVRECCNYDCGNCLLLDDGEECICPQSITYSLICKWFRGAVLPLDAGLCAALFPPPAVRRRYCKPNDDPNNFSFEIEPLSEDAGLLVDTEDAQVTEMKIRGFDGYRIEKIHSKSGRQRIMYLWFDLENKLIFFYDSVGVLPEESQKIFDGIVIYGYEADTPAPTSASSGPLIIKDGMPFEFSYVPEGYAVFQKLSSEPEEDNIWYSCFYVDEHDDANNFSMEVFSVDESSAGVVDTENATIQNVIIHGHNGMAISKIDTLTQRNQMQYVWLDEENNLFYSYFSFGITSEESQKIFDGIVIYE